MNFVPFQIIWRYFGWANQTLSAVTLWCGAVFLAKRGRYWWIAALPATFMTVMTSSYILVAGEGLGLSHTWGTVLGLTLGAGALGVFLVFLPRLSPDANPD